MVSKRCDIHEMFLHCIRCFPVLLPRPLATSAHTAQHSTAQHSTSHFYSPTSPKRATARLILSPTFRIISKYRTQCEAQAADEVPSPNVPAEHVEGGEVPFLLGLEHEECAGNDEAETANDLGRPVDSVGGREVSGSTDVRNKGEW